MKRGQTGFKVGLQGILKRGEGPTVKYVCLYNICVCVCVFYKQFFIINKCEGGGDGEEQVRNGQA
jgi:hypothetical protein